MLQRIDLFTNFMHTILTKVVPDNLKACLRFVRHVATTNLYKVDSKYWNTIVRYRLNEMTRYQVRREETSINLTDISKQVYWVSFVFQETLYFLGFLDKIFQRQMPQGVPLSQVNGNTHVCSPFSIWVGGGEGGYLADVQESKGIAVYLVQKYWSIVLNS